MFMKDGVELPCPDSAAGLYIKTRTDQIVKVWNSSNARDNQWWQMFIIACFKFLLHLF